MNIYTIRSKYGLQEGIANSYEEAFRAYCECYETYRPENVVQQQYDGNSVEFLWCDENGDKRVVTITQHDPDFIGAEPNKEKYARCGRE